MKKQCSIQFWPSLNFLAVPLMIAGMLLNSTFVVAQNTIPFNAMMQSASTQAPVPPRPDGNGASGQQVKPAHITAGGKAEIVGGFLLFGVGVVVISAAAAFNSWDSGSDQGRLTAAYIGGAGAVAGGVTLVAFGFHKRSKK
jgi:hypothetical protein